MSKAPSLREEGEKHLRARIIGELERGAEQIFFMPSISYRRSARSKASVSIPLAPILEEFGCARVPARPNVWANPHAKGGTPTDTPPGIRLIQRGERWYVADERGNVLGSAPDRERGERLLADYQEDRR